MTPGKPSVSAVITTFNRAEMVVEAVESVLAQTYADLEVLVIDDGSSDGTRIALERLSDRVRYYWQENAGPSSARNRGIELARGDFIAFLDSDDLWMPGKIEQQMEFLESHREFSLCYTDEIWIRGGRRVNQGKRHRKYGGWIFPRVLPLCIISPSSVLMSSWLFDDVGRFDESLPACEDYDMWIRTACRYQVGYLAEPLIVKRGGRPDQLSRTVESLDRYRVKALLNAINSGILDVNQRSLAITQLEQKCGVYGRGCIKRGRVEEGEYYLNLVDSLPRE
jgi:glycosyltransferase involved in cell wall biosynthesis